MKEDPLLTGPPWLDPGMLLIGNSNWTSPYVLSCFVALREKQLPFEVKTIALNLGAQREPSFAKQSLTSRVPVLVDGDLALSESSAIIREERSAEYVFYPHDRLQPLTPLSPRAERAAAKLLVVAGQMVPPDGGCLFGPWCVADTDLAMMLQRLLKTGHDMPERIRAYATAQWQRPAAREFLDQDRPPYQRALLD